ncbi:MAG: phenylalanine--tRNA ligase subunit alpha [Solirubrobacteraceae bacterium]|nr:phenylalanine--tRNA ligase subunit alpha [Solirubrobacteraceae bacterium]
MAVTDRIAEIQTEAEEAIAAAGSTAELEELRVRFLGRKAELPNLLRTVSELPPEQRGAVGKAANIARQALEGQISGREQALAGAELEAQLERDRVDITLPGTPAQPVGSLHVLHQTWREIEDVFLGLGFTVLDGPEVETVHYNFDALNHDPAHPARAWTDTFYVADDVVLRTHTSPMQVRAMEQHPPPLYVVIPGRVYRRDHDATHLPQFHQVEGLAVDEDITLADLKGTLLSFARTIFGDEREIRLRPHFFPFTEPSVEIDVSCSNCKGGTLKDGSRCPVCKGTTWLEILGAGLVDPNVLRAVGNDAYDPDTVSGFAFGMGIERIAMLKHGIPDLRLYIENDVRFLEQFG